MREGAGEMRVVGTMRGWRWEDEWLGNDRGQGFSRVCKRERRMKLDGREREGSRD